MVRSDKIFFYLKNMEKNLKIKTRDKYLVYGTLTTSQKPSSALVIFVHGLTGLKNEHQFFNGTKFFIDHGFNVFRFDLYSGEKGGRLLRDTSISIHAQDLNTVVKYFRKKFKKIFVIGHSLGGLTIFKTDLSKVEGIVLWDSSTNNWPKFKKFFKFKKSLKGFIMNWGMEYVLGKKMYNELMSVPTPKELAAKVNKPIKIIVAGNGDLKKAGAEYFCFAKHPKEFAVIAGAGHTFDEEGVEEKLFKSTLDFLKSFNKS